MLEWFTSLPHYSFGGTLFALLAIVPALVSGNMLVHASSLKPVPWKVVVGNGVIFVLSAAVIMYAVWDGLLR